MKLDGSRMPPRDDAWVSSRFLPGQLAIQVQRLEKEHKDAEWSRQRVYAYRGYVYQPFIKPSPEEVLKTIILKRSAWDATIG